MHETNADAVLRMSYVAYRDYLRPCDDETPSGYHNPGIDVCNFTEDIPALRTVVGRQHAGGGDNDGPKDVCGGLRSARRGNIKRS
jgi:hypothetical protein